MDVVPIEHCPDTELTKLPDDAVTTNDDHALRLGSVIYFRFGAGPAATEYAVISDRAIRDRSGFRILVVGPRGIPAAMNPKDFVSDVNEWWQFWQKRYGSPRRRNKQNGQSQTRDTCPTDRGSRCQD